MGRAMNVLSEKNILTGNAPDSLRRVIANAPSAVALLDQQFCYVTASQRWKTDFKMGDNLAGKCHPELFRIPGKDWGTAYQQAIEGHSSENERDLLIFPNGIEQWVCWHVQPWNFDNGEIGGVLVYMDLMIDEAERDSASRRMLALYEQTNEVASIGGWEVDLIKNEIYWSSITKRIHGVPEEYIPNLTFAIDFFKEGDNRNKIRSAFLAAVENGTSYDLELEMITAGGDELWVRVKGNAEYTNGVCTRIYGTFQDIQTKKLQEIRLINSELKYRSIIENSLYAFMQTIPESVIIDANKAAEDMFGYTMEEFLHIGRGTIIDESEPALQEFLETRDRAGKASADLTGIRKNGERFPCHIASATYTDIEGKKLNSLMIIDITERRKAEQQIRTSEEQFRGAFEYSAIGMALFSIDGWCKRANQSLCNMLGYTQAELTSLRFDDITHPDDLPRNIELLNELINGTRDSYHLEKRYLHKSGKPVWVLLGVSILREVNNDPVHFISQIQDVTKFKEAELAMAISEEKYRKIFENTQDIYYRTDKNGIITEISPSIEKYYGDNRQNIIGNPVIDFYYYKKDRDRILNALKQDCSVTDFEMKLKTMNNELRYASVNARLIVENGVVLGSEGSIRDITLRKLQENELTSLNTELKALNNHREKLLSVIGHDLKNPVAASLKLAELALMDVAQTSKEELLEYLYKMESGLQNANDLLEDLLRWAKNQFNSMDFNPVWIDELKVQVLSCFKRLKPMAESKGIELLETIDEGIKLYADKDMLDTIIRNLVSNAIKFTAAGSIVVNAVRREDDVLFCVTDTGSGMSESIIRQLFDKSSHYTTYGTLGEKGTGLGLELCKNFVERHRGKIWVESTPGQGSSFYFTISTIGLS
jgi:PAS domain S-box-containing protein